MRGRHEAEPASAAADALSAPALLLENALLMRELGRAQRRCSEWRDDAARRIEQLEAQLIRSRAECIVKQTQLDALRTALADLRQRQLHPEPAAHAAHAAPPASLRGRRVLCVGGRTRQMPLYQALVESRGGRFAQACGTDESGLPHLRAALAEADIVVLQPRYASQGACRLVQTHCTDAGVCLLLLDKCCLPGFASSLDAVLAAAAAA